MDKGKSIRGLYQVKGSKLRICLGAPNGERPKTFKQEEEIVDFLCLKLGAEEEPKHVHEVALPVSESADRLDPRAKSVLLHLTRPGEAVPFGKKEPIADLPAFLKKQREADPSATPAMRIFRDLSFEEASKILFACRKCGYTFVELRVLLISDKVKKDENDLDSLFDRSIPEGRLTVRLDAAKEGLSIRLRGYRSEPFLGLIQSYGVEQPGGKEEELRGNKKDNELLKRLKEAKKENVTLKTEGPVRYEHWLRVLDLCRKAGVKHIHLAAPEE
jgi:biopolymer transport protein ExbD